MRLRIKGRHVELSDSVTDYAETKLRKLDKQLAEPMRVELELWEEHNPSIHDSHVAEATIWTKGPTLRAREAATSFEAAVDEVVAKLDRQVKRYRDKRRRRDVALRGAGSAAATPEPTPVEELDRQLRAEP
jgi:putative sigma-54 modulation protein